MARIRVNPEILIQKSADLTVAAVGLRGLGDDVKHAAESAPSYDGQFGPFVSALGLSALISGKKRAESIADHSSDLVQRASAFLAADTTDSKVITTIPEILTPRLIWLRLLAALMGLTVAQLLLLLRLGLLRGPFWMFPFPWGILPYPPRFPRFPWLRPFWPWPWWPRLPKPPLKPKLPEPPFVPKAPEAVPPPLTPAVPAQSEGVDVSSPFIGGYIKTGDFGIYMEGYAKYKDVGGAVHNGIDVKPKGDDKNVHPLGPGKVVEIGENKAGNGYGNYVRVEHQLSDGRTVIVTYAHLSSTSTDLTIGIELTGTETLGVMGGSGSGNANQFPEHLHMDMYEKDNGRNFDYRKQVTTVVDGKATLKPSDKMANGQTYEESMRANWINIEDILNGNTDVEFLEVEDWKS